MKLEEFDYYLPGGYIAQKPMKPRDHSRLMVLDRGSQEIRHSHFRNIVDYLKAGDLLVLNNTKVLPVRLLGAKENTKGKIEILLLNPRDGGDWEVLIKPGKSVHPGTRIIFAEGLNGVVKTKEEEKGVYLVEFNFKGDFQEILERIGKIPTPPYIKEELEEKDDYQTVYAVEDGSIAAPTAGFHFTKPLLKEISSKGVEIVYITLHIGRGTFEPVRVSEIEKHKMSAEFYSISPEVTQKINRAHREKRRIIAVGTSTTRTLESAFNPEEGGMASGGSNWSNLFIYPGYKFKLVEVLVTNFHLPQSTPLLLVSAFAGKDFIFRAYEEAIREKYRFYSFGDAMMII